MERRELPCQRSATNTNNTNAKTMTIRCKIDSEKQTELLAAALHAAFPANAMVALDGTLGAGKTRFVRAFAVASGVPAEAVTSPTFTLWQTHQGTRVIHHLDAYRVADEDEFDALGIEDCFEAEAVTFVEWASRVENCLPKENRVNIHFEVVSDCERTITISASPEVEVAIKTVLSASSIEHEALSQ